MSKLILDYVYDKEAAHPERVYLTQPTGAGATTDYTWGRVLDEARRMAAHLQSLGLQPGDRVAILSKNCAHFFMAELAIWIGGYTSTARRRRSSSASSTRGPRKSRAYPPTCRASRSRSRRRRPSTRGTPSSGARSRSRGVSRVRATTWR